MDPPPTTFLSRNTYETYTVAPAKKQRVYVSQVLDSDGGRERNAVPRVESCGRTRVIRCAPALLLENVAAVEQALEKLKVIDIVQSQKGDLLLYRRSSGRAGWKRMCEFSASNLRRDQNIESAPGGALSRKMLAHCIHIGGSYTSVVY